jgi:hypothetical protein
MNLANKAFTTTISTCGVTEQGYRTHTIASGSPSLPKLTVETNE